MRKNILLRNLIEALFVDEESGALNDEDLALVLACFEGNDLKSFTMNVHKVILEIEPVGSDIRNIANHYLPISRQVAKNLKGSNSNYFVTAPWDFIYELEKNIRRQRPEISEKILDMLDSEDDTNDEKWTSFENIRIAASMMADWITGLDDYENTDDYTEGYDRMLNNAKNVERFSSLMHAGPHLVKFLSTSNDEQLIDGIIRLILSGPDDAIQAGELVKSLGD